MSFSGEYPDFITRSYQNNSYQAQADQFLQYLLCGKWTPARKFYEVFLILLIVENCFVAFIFLTSGSGSRPRHHNHFNMLCIAAVNISGMGLDIKDFVKEYCDWDTTATCRWTGFALSVLTYSPLAVIVTMSIDRVVATFCWKFYEFRAHAVSAFRLTILFGFLATFCFMFIIPFLHIGANYEFEPFLIVCVLPRTPDSAMTKNFALIVQSFVLLLLVCLLISGSFVASAAYSYSNASTMKNRFTSLAFGRLGVGKSKSWLSVSRITLIITIITICSYLPLTIISLTRIFYDQFHEMFHPFDIVANLLLLVNPLMNPIVSVWFYDPHRRRAIQLFNLLRGRNSTSSSVIEENIDSSGDSNAGGANLRRSYRKVTGDTGDKINYYPYRIHGGALGDQRGKQWRGGDRNVMPEENRYENILFDIPGSSGQNMIYNTQISLNEVGKVSDGHDSGSSISMRKRRSRVSPYSSTSTSTGSNDYNVNARKLRSVGDSFDSSLFRRAAKNGRHAEIKAVGFFQDASRQLSNKYSSDSCEEDSTNQRKSLQPPEYHYHHHLHFYDSKQLDTSNKQGRRGSLPVVEHQVPIHRVLNSKIYRDPTVGHLPGDPREGRRSRRDKKSTESVRGARLHNNSSFEMDLLKDVHPVHQDQF